MSSDKIGRIVWHDLFTDDAQASQSFYQTLAGWRYMIEHAKDFAWGGGERDFNLALSGDEAGAGFVENAPGQPNGWVPYIEMRDVDAAAKRAVDLGGSIEKAPFEVPGVGRNCLLRDPSGARVGICLSRHNFPAPTRQFGAEVYLGPPGSFPMDFYRGLFGWTEAAPHLEADHSPSWVPTIRVTDLTEALRRLDQIDGATLHSAAEPRNMALVNDPTGAFACLAQP